MASTSMTGGDVAVAQGVADGGVVLGVAAGIGQLCCCCIGVGSRI